MSLDTHGIRLALYNRFPLTQGYAAIEEVGNGTGHRCNRHADAIVMNLWPSRGLEVMGFEFKASRSDWVKELKDPGKADPIFQYCDRWYLVVSDALIVKPGELPAGWGLMTPHPMGDGLFTLRDVSGAEKLSPKPLDRSFVAAMLRAAAKNSATKKAIEAARSAGHAAGLKSGEENRKFIDKSAAAALADLTHALSEFERVSGISIIRYTDGEQLGEMVKVAKAISAHHGGILATLRGAKNNATRIIDEADEVIAAIESIRGKAPA